MMQRNKTMRMRWQRGGFSAERSALGGTWGRFRCSLAAGLCWMLDGHQVRDLARLTLSAMRHPQEVVAAARHCGLVSGWAGERDLDFRLAYLQSGECILAVRQECPADMPGSVIVFELRCGVRGRPIVCQARALEELAELFHDLAQMTTKPTSELPSRSL